MASEILLKKKEGCPKCSIATPITNMNEIGPGDHISMKGEIFSKTKSSSFMKYLYTHHAIVKTIIAKTDDDKGALIELYHVTPPERDKTNVGIVKNEQKALNVDKDAIKKISYKGNSCFEKKEVVDIAEKLFERNNHGILSNRSTSDAQVMISSDSLESDTDSDHRLLTDDSIHDTRSYGSFNKDQSTGDGYLLFINNCEHFCHRCCVGEHESLQVSRLTNCCQHILESLLYSVPMIVRILLKVLILTTHDYVRNVWIGGVLLSIMLCVYFLFVLVFNCQYAFFFTYTATECCYSLAPYCCCTRLPWLCCIKCPGCCCHCCKLKDKENSYCEYCHNRDKALRWLRFAVIAFFQVIGYSIVVVMIKYDFENWHTLLAGIVISLFTMVMYTFLPQLILRCCKRLRGCWCKLPSCCAKCCCNYNEIFTV